MVSSPCIVCLVTLHRTTQGKRVTKGYHSSSKHREFYLYDTSRFHTRNFTIVTLGD